ncbi:MAG: FAD-dependent monooxygenase, partial [Robiginitomaculum sp.]
DVTAWLGPHKHFISYAIRGGELINFVAIEEREAWAQEGWSHKGNLATMRKAFDDWDGPVTAIMEAAESCFLWGLFDRPPLERWSDGRVCLLGDACHPMLPFMAQGAAMAVEDSWALTDRIMNYPASIPAALRAYAAARKPRAELMQKLSSDNAKLFHRASPAARTLRDLKFKAGMAMPSAVHAKLDKIYGVNVTKC